jgi:hypothetical protein
MISERVPMPEAGVPTESAAAGWDL